MIQLLCFGFITERTPKYGFGENVPKICMFFEVFISNIKLVSFLLKCENFNLKSKNKINEIIKMEYNKRIINWKIG